MTTESIAKIVKAAAVWLDEIKPGWEKLVDGKRFNMDYSHVSCGDRCLLDYVFAEEAAVAGYVADGWSWVEENLSLPRGFIAQAEEPYWRKEIAVRIANPPVPITTDVRQAAAFQEV